MQMAALISSIATVHLHNPTQYNALREVFIYHLLMQWNGLRK